MHLARSSFFSALATLSLILLSGCSQYEWGRPAPAFKTIYVQPVTNSTFVPQAQASLSAQIRKAIIRDGRLQLANKPAQAEAILQVNLTEYQRENAVRSSEDSEIALGFDLILEAEIALIHQRSNQYLIQNRSHRATTNTFGRDFSTGEDTFSQSEYQAMTRLTKNLADEIASTVLDVW